MKNLNPLVSICIPVYNGASMIHRTLESCVNQTYRNIEIIVVDNASADNTKEVVSRYIKADKRIKYFRNNTNIGLIRNFLRCLELAKGDFSQFLCHDDWLSRNYIEEGTKILSFNPDVGSVFSKVVALTEDNEHFSLNFEIILQPKVYSSSYFFRNTYKSQLGANDILGFFRIKDLKETISFILELLKHPKYGKLYETSFPVDWMIAPKILLKYPLFIYTDKSAYIKTEHPQNTGKQFKYGFMGMTMIELCIAFQTCFEQLYKKELKKYLLGFRVSFGINSISEVIVNFIKGNLSKDDLIKEFNKKDLKLFFENYSILEKTLVFIGIIPKFILRGFGFILRRFIKKFRKKTLSCLPQDIFLEKKESLLRFKN